MTVLLVAMLAACPPSTEALPEAQRAAACQVDARFEHLDVRPDAQGELAAIYARPSFRGAHSSQAGDLFKRLKAWLEAIFETSGAETYSNVTRVVVLLLASFVVIAVVVRLTGRRLRRPRAPEVQPASALELDDPARHLARAQALLPTDARASAREGLLAILAALERQRLARPDRVKTNRELARELPSRGAPPALVEAVTAQLSWFDRAWYSLEPFDPTRAKAFVEEAGRLVAQVASLGAREPA
ncbi:MAG: DUF4129 domain-containing protein [Myxococcaceae bacterium]|nr:DUF4129 domain-containing protein [Myxococcaceae bacterium]